jgi:hypothetical protein
MGRFSWKPDGESEPLKSHGEAVAVEIGPRDARCAGRKGLTHAASEKLDGGNLALPAGLVNPIPCRVVIGEPR